MSDTVQTSVEPAHTSDLLEALQESARGGQRAAADAMRAFQKAVNDAIPDALQPLRTKLIDAAIELAENLANAQYQFNRSLIRTADAALSKAESDGK
jgi:hypothetical protein